MSQFQEAQVQSSPDGPHAERGIRENIGGHARHQVGDYVHDISDRLRSVSDRGQHYYQQAAHAARADGAVLTGVLVAGALGFATAWLIFARHAVSGEYVARRMSESSEHYH